MGLTFAEQIEAPRVVLSELTAANSWPEGQIVYVTDLDAIYVSTGAAWVAAVSPPATLVDAKGDLLVGTGNDALSRLVAGTDGQLLYTSSVTGPHGLKWRDPAEGIDAVARYDLDTTGSTSVSANIQAAFDAAHALSVADTSISAAAVKVLFRPGTFRLTSGLTWKCHHIAGIFPNVSTRFKWDGSAGATVLTRDMSVRGGGSFVELGGIHFRDGTARPGKWVSMVSADPDVQLVDKFLHMHHLNFEGSSGNAVQLNAHFVNAHFEHLRWDATGGYAIEVVPPDNLGNLGTFLIERFTYDHNRAGDSAPGMIHIDNTQGSTNLGTFTLRGGRIETNVAWGTHQGVVVVTAGIGHSVKVHLEDVTFQDVGSLMASDCLLFHDGVAAGEYLQLTNVHVGALSTVVAGTLPASYPSVPVKAGWAYANIHGGGAIVVPFHTDGTAQGIEARGTTTSGTYPVQVYRSSEAVPRIRLRNNGAIELSDGTTQDVSLSRAAANRLGLEAGDEFQAGGKVYPGTDAATLQTASGLYAGTGVPNNANGANGDFYLRGDGTVAGNTVMYHKEAGSWVALTTT